MLIFVIVHYEYEDAVVQYFQNLRQKHFKYAMKFYYYQYYNHHYY